MSITTMLCGKRLWIAGLIAAFSIAALAQMEPRAMSFMHAMKDSMERMDNGMKSAPIVPNELLAVEAHEKRIGNFDANRARQSRC